MSGMTERFARKWILKNKEPVEVSLLEWAAWFERAERHVDVTKVGDNTTVSTVFLGTDHNFSEDGPPLIFETLIFGGPAAGYQTRSSTWAEAEEHHARAVAVARSHLN